MDTIMEFDIFDQEINDIDIHEFKEFCNDLTSLHILVDPEFYLEAMVDNNKSFFGKLSIKKPLENTRKTTKDIKKAYSNVTDGYSTLIKSMWNLTMKSIQLASKVLKFIFVNLSEIPKSIIKTFQLIGKIPGNVKNKIKGNITLYMTINDINMLHNKLLPLIDDFLMAADDMSKGNIWGTFFHRRPIGDGAITKHITTENDMKYFKKMKSIYEKLKMIDFNQTLVKFEDQNIVDMYFGGSKSIKYKSVEGKIVESNYYDALIDIFNNFRQQSEFLKRIQGDMNKKFDDAQMNQSFSKLNESEQKTISDSITMISKVINIMGHLMKYSIIDIKTIKNSATKILNKSNISTVK